MHAPPPGPMERRRGGEATFWTVALWIDLGLILLSAVLSIATLAVLTFAPDSDIARDFNAAVPERLESFVLGLLLTFAMFGIVPFLWVWRTRLGGWPATKEYFRLHRPAHSLAVGTAVGIGVVVAILVLLTAAQYASCALTGHGITPEGNNPVTDAIQAHLSWPLAILIALIAGIGEEIFFRGFLQRQLGFWSQGILFALAHAANASLLQMVVTLAIGFGFGLWVRRGGSLYVVIAAHVTYDLAILGLTMGMGAQAAESPVCP